MQSEGENDPVLHTLLTCINRFSDDLALCRVQALNEDLRQIAQALQTPPKESKTLISLFFHLLNDRFRMEFEGLLASQENNRRALDKLPELVSWCAKHGLYQQALTLLCEQMPEYICSHTFFTAYGKRVQIFGNTEREQRETMGVSIVSFPFLPDGSAAAKTSLYGRFALEQKQRK